MMKTQKGPRKGFEFWNLLEEELNTISEKKLGSYTASASLAIAIIISAGRDRDAEFLYDDLFVAYAKAAGLNPRVIREILLKAITAIDAGSCVRINTQEELSE